MQKEDCVEAGPQNMFVNLLCHQDNSFTNIFWGPAPTLSSCLTLYHPKVIAGSAAKSMNRAELKNCCSQAHMVSLEAETGSARPGRSTQTWKLTGTNLSTKLEAVSAKWWTLAVSARSMTLGAWPNVDSQALHTTCNNQERMHTSILQ